MSSEASSSLRGKARLVVIGGFLGAGKTTAIAQFAKYLKARHQTPAVITNDHGSDLVDTSILRGQGIFAEGIEGGDLCTRADEAMRVAARVRSEQHADVLVAEPAGTCAELATAVLARARKLLSSNFAVAPLSVLVDPVRAARMLRLESSGKLAHEIADLYRKQIEEAEILVINKTETLSGNKLPALRDALGEVSPRAKIFAVSAKTGAGLEEWFECLMSKETSVAPAGDVRPAASTEPGALLAWLNCTVTVSSVRYFDAGKLLIDLATCVQSLFQQEGGEIAHLKMALNPEHDGSGIAAASLERNDASPQLLRDISEPIQRGELILNARAEGDPEILHSAVNRALLALMERSPDLFARMQHCEHFRAGQSRGSQAASS
jgi:G3E family GTPase